MSNERRYLRHPIEVLRGTQGERMIPVLEPYYSFADGSLARNAVDFYDPNREPRRVDSEYDQLRLAEDHALDAFRLCEEAPSEETRSALQARLAELCGWYARQMGRLK